MIYEDIFNSTRPCRIYEQVKRQLTGLKVCHLRQGAKGAAIQSVL